MVPHSVLVSPSCDVKSEHICDRFERNTVMTGRDTGVTSKPNCDLTSTAED